MVNTEDEVSISQQCILLNIARSSAYYQCQPRFNESDLEIMRRIDEIYTEEPFKGYRRIWDDLQEQNIKVGRDRVLQYMQEMGICAIYPKRRFNTSISNPEHRVYPYLLRDIEINRPNQVWAIDITYIPLQGKFCYLVAIIDWHSRYILSWRLSNSLDSEFCRDALNEALAKYPHPEIFNSDQGCQFTSHDFTAILKEQEIQISMDGKGRAIDNVIIERFFRTLKYEDIYLKHYASIREARNGINQFMHKYNNQRKHSTLKARPCQIYAWEPYMLN
jgi:putative transposase